MSRFPGVGLLTQHVKPLSATLTSHMGASSSPGYSTSNAASSKYARKAKEDGSGTRTLISRWRTGWSFWLLATGPVVSVCEVNQQTDLSNPVFQINPFFFFKELNSYNFYQILVSLLIIPPQSIEKWCMHTLFGLMASS